ncbi:siderophore-interacting protein [Haematobacter massiliensis]|uniref:Siderophore-interacting protein n=1 Tax=Haematobacter massiliensis TaxID=195105 RepID=A0A086Y537_9RHOB|nr:siderophore-interacting protein [Haematobacter massiliensis]KFI29387.1 siderophore-interacting protein [Haematobacter massiliensis]
MPEITTTARVTTPEAPALARLIAEHLGSHGARVETGEGVWRIDFGLRRATVTVAEDVLKMEAWGADASLAHEMRLDLGEHLAEFGGPKVDWGLPPTTVPPNFRQMEIVAVEDITPAMRRLRLSGPDLLRFADPSALHCKLLLPPVDEAPVWPHFDAEGRFTFGNGIVRKYTIRRIDPVAGWMEIDFVLHHDAGPGSAFAAKARVGERLALVGPGGGGIPRQGHVLLAGDETALPAIARALEEAAPDMQGHAYIEVADAAEHQDIRHPDGVALHWVLRDGAPGAALVAALKELSLLPETYVWAGLEFTAFRALRSHLRTALNHPREAHLVTAYWRKGAAGES